MITWPAPLRAPAVLSWLVPELNEPPQPAQVLDRSPELSSKEEDAAYGGFCYGGQVLEDSYWILSTP